ncbi:MAG TPA: tRNA pseudouridine(55) synthase TruB, partial [Bacteroidota bacterium]|nr:tRNA pseudouridine(55) synthase TruB [Bacteroidota bacterium]
MMDPKSDVPSDEGTVLLVRKPAGWTSFDVVNKIRHLFGIRKVGHAGTLDPLATGLLIVCTGRKTKEIGSLVGLEKEYEAEMTLGARTASFDAATPVLETRSTEGITEDAVRSVLLEFVGTQHQVPPMWSALKVGGRRLYKYAREGTEVSRAAREVSV